MFQNVSDIYDKINTNLIHFQGTVVGMTGIKQARKGLVLIVDCLLIHLDVAALILHLSEVEAIAMASTQKLRESMLGIVEVRRGTVKYW